MFDGVDGGDGVEGLGGVDGGVDEMIGVDGGEGVEGVGVGERQTGLKVDLTPILKSSE